MNKLKKQDGIQFAHPIVMLKYINQRDLTIIIGIVIAIVVVFFISTLNPETLGPEANQTSQSRIPTINFDLTHLKFVITKFIKL